MRHAGLSIRGMARELGIHGPAQVDAHPFPQQLGGEGVVGALERCVAGSTTAAASSQGWRCGDGTAAITWVRGGGAMFAVGRQQPAGVALAHPQSSAAGAMGTWYSKTELST